MLHVGCGTGYGSAVLSHLAGMVVALESDGTLAEMARAALRALGLTNVQVVEGPLEAGCPSEAPYDAVLIEGAVEYIPDAFTPQLAEGGRLVAIVGEGRSAQGLVLRRTGAVLNGFAAFGAAAPRLPGFSRPPAFVF